MKEISINNRELKKIIGDFLEVLLKVDRSKFPYQTNPAPFDDADYACGVEYLTHMQGKRVDGFPEKTGGVDLLKYVSPFASLQVAIKKLDEQLLAWSGARNSAVKMVYPKGGYMGWHHNANAPGYNILLSWSEKGTGYFKYQDPITKEFVVLQDKPGWTCKVGYFGKFTEPDKVIWHCANAKHEERVTLAYVIPHLGLWTDMVEDIQSA